MKLSTFGFALTLAAVAMLLGSLVLGLRGPPGGAGVPVASLGDATSPAPQPERIRVEVLNAAGVSGLARRVTERLRDAGFDVVFYGNAGADTRRDSTTILDRGGDPAAVAAVADELGVTRVESAVDTTLYLEATVVIAEDWEEP